MSKRFCFSVLAFVLIFSMFGALSTNAAKGDLKEDIVEVEHEGPEIKYPTETYVDENGNEVTIYLGEIPDQFVTDEKGNILSTENSLVEAPRENGEVSTNSCTYQYYHDVVSEVVDKRNHVVNYHPHFPSWDKVDFYYFGKTSKTKLWNSAKIGQIPGFLCWEKTRKWG